MQRVSNFAARTDNMKCIAIFLLVLAVIFVTATADSHGRRSPRSCPRNEVWKDCGTACEPSCRRPRPRGCITSCVAACQCKRGFLRNKRGQCVSHNHC